MKEKNFTTSIKIPEGVNVSIEDHTLLAEGPKGKNSREFAYQGFSMKLSEDKSVVVLTFDLATKREKMLMNTISAHIENIFAGVLEKYTYTLKVCSSHFPMNVSYKSNELIVKNFLGEKANRILSIPEGVELKIDGTNIILTGVDKEKVGTVASRIESLTRITNRDRRIFQDGIFITDKNGKSTL